jgi:putative N6-adenine-specific DNA methylase
VTLRFLGSDRDAGAVRMAGENAERAGVAALVAFEQRPVEELEPPEGPPGLVIVNPPYGARIGQKGPLLALHRRLGDALKAKFAGWRVGIITADAELARATGLPFEKPGAPVLHGGIRVLLWKTGPLPGKG